MSKLQKALFNTYIPLKNEGYRLQKIKKVTIVSGARDQERGRGCWWLLDTSSSVRLTRLRVPWPGGIRKEGGVCRWLSATSAYVVTFILRPSRQELTRD
jgi:hypothetical protein